MRHPTKQDVPEIIDLAKEIKLFDSDEEIDELIRKPLEDYLAQSAASASSPSQWWITDALAPVQARIPATSSSGGSSIACASFTGPQPEEPGAFNMYFIGVRPEVQKQGLGAIMVDKVEEWGKGQQGVRVLVETASQMDGAQAFYKKLGYVERKRMKDMYGEGIDAVQYAKEL